MLKISVFYLIKQKSFIPKNNMIQDVVCLLTQFSATDLLETRLRQKLFHRNLWSWALATKLETPQMALLEQIEAKKFFHRTLWFFGLGKPCTKKGGAVHSERGSIAWKALQKKSSKLRQNFRNYCIVLQSLQSYIVVVTS